MIGEPNSAEIRYLALVPAKQRPDPRQTRNRLRRLQDPHLEVLLSRQSRGVANFGIVAVRRPGIGELHPAAGLVQRPRFAFEGFARNQFNPSALHGLDPVDAAVVREAAIARKCSHNCCGHHRPMTKSGSSESHMGTTHHALIEGIFSRL